ncbi:hypothetical protein ATO6_23010 [Oceanicola sp. 22II-s10i]|nr:hypothetical protein ATO6_23010 [Oceanicola sp. 22II-s10i]
MIGNSLALKLLADVMDWDDATATREFGWLRLMASVKYDGYADFAAGAGFLEALVDWMRQFDTSYDRAIAYRFVKQRLVYISTAEMHRVVEAFIPEVVTPYLRRSVGAECGLHPWEVWAANEPAEAFKSRLRKCLFVGLSDGSRIDVLRRSNAGRISQEQIIPMMNVDDAKWESLGEDLISAPGLDANSRFEDVFLIDDFTASGTTFIRTVEGKTKGKLHKFNKMVEAARRSLSAKEKVFPISENYSLHIHHYVSTSQARGTLTERVGALVKMLENRSFRDEVHITEGLLLSDNLPLGRPKPGLQAGGAVEASAIGFEPNRIAENEIDAQFIALCERAYDPELFRRLEKHCREAGMETMCYGYGGCALPLVLEHNTPNNSVPLIWSETGSEADPNTRPLFQRRDRHG